MRKGEKGRGINTSLKLSDPGSFKCKREPRLRSLLDSLSLESYRKLNHRSSAQKALIKARGLRLEKMLR